ncbi:MAG: UPF0182 family protein [Actinomycetota bacterium]|jgi:uncharacterized membrane protein (UPF0182 family)|nr:UPF0182 family protein [Actinomycetota bacterium]
MTLRERLRRRWWLALLGLLVVIVVFATRVASFYTDALWFDSIGFAGVFWKLLGTRVALGLVAGVLVTALVAGNMLLARRLAPAYRIASPQEAVVERYRQALLPYVRPVLLSVAVMFGLLAGLSMAARWSTYLLWANAQEFGRVDPQFGRDLGFFVFVLPFHVLLNSWLFASLVLALLATAAAHYVFGGIRPQSPGQKVTPQANVHLSLLLAALVGIRAWGFRLDQYLLSYSQRGVITGLSYTDVNAQLPAYRLLLVIAVICLVLFLVNVRARGWLLPTAGVGILLVAAVVLAGIFPTVIQRLRVAPQELDRERPFIEENLQATRFAFGLDDVDTESFPAAGQLSAEQIDANSETLSSVRLWSPTTAQPAYEQLQALRPYYNFRDVDVDRYEVDGTPTQVVVSAREISERTLPAGTWQNQRLAFTHGYGVVASRVSSATVDGQPVFLAEDIPQRGVPAFDIDNPRIYFGEDPPEYSIVGTGQPEIDYAIEGGGTEEFAYAGADGVDVGSIGRRLAFALRFAEPNILLSNLLTADSKVLYRRQVRERVQSVAPFLKLDHDPYPVAAGGRVQWVVDAYTTTDMIPYSQRFDLAQLTLADQPGLVLRTSPDGTQSVAEERVQQPALRGRANYIRNSVKAVVDAYDGTVRLYVIDDQDPLIAAWRAVFPAVFLDGDELSDELRSHLRYPEDMFRVQSSVFLDYHIEGADDFYTREDAWKLPADPAFSNNQANVVAERRESRTVRPTYQLLRLPGEDDSEFALLQTFLPAGSERRNLIAYLAGRGDPEQYGQLKAFVMPPSKTVFGPEQVQARIDADEEIARDVSLLNQRGSMVIYGDLLTVPIADALLYVEPLFLQAEQSSIPELTRVILVLDDQVVSANTLAQALQRLFGVVPGSLVGPGEEPSDSDPEPPPSGEVGADPRIEDLIGQALAAFEDAEAALRDGRLGRYQALTRQAQQRLAEAQALLEAGDAEPGPAPSESPTEG